MTRQWLSGLIDGNAQFILTKSGYASLKIITSITDKLILNNIKYKYGGSIKSIAGSNSLRYKLKNKKRLIKLIYSVNGLIKNSTRLLKLYKICVLYAINFIETKRLKLNNGWFAGFLDAQGSIYLNEKSEEFGYISISITQKNKSLLDSFIPLYSGKVYPLLSKEAFQYSLYKKEEILNIINNYFNIYSLKSSKKHKLNLIKKYYDCRQYRDLYNQPYEYNNWFKFKNEWDKL